jgi:Flp pilus assembly protein TadD
VKFPRSFVLFAVFALFLPAACFSQAPPPQGVSVSAAGTVLMSGDDRPVRQALVELFLAEFDSTISVLTDDNGQFQFAQVSGATYRITVTAPGCETFQLTVSLPATGPFVFRLRKSAYPAIPRNHNVVSVQELAMSGKAARAFEKGTRLLLKGDVEASLPYFRMVIEEVPSSYRPYHNLAIALYKVGQLDAAAEAFQKSIELTSGGFAPSMFGLSMIFYQHADYREAESLIRKGLLVAPGSGVGRYCLGLVQYSLGRVSEAERSAGEALRLKPDEADIHVLLARIHERQHNPSAVVADVQAYLKLDPNGALHGDALDLLQRAQQDISR